MEEVTINGPTVVFEIISVLEFFPVDSGRERVVFVPFVGTCRLDVSSLQHRQVSAESDTLIWVILTSSFDSGVTSVDLEVAAVSTDTAAVTEDGCASESSE